MFLAPTGLITLIYEVAAALGLFWRKRRCSQGPHIEIRGRDSFLGVEADRHFEDLWSSAVPVDFARMVAPVPELAAAR
jgi:hypothetical protein